MMSDFKMSESIYQLGHQEMVSRHCFLELNHQKVMSQIFVNSFSQTKVVQSYHNLMPMLQVEKKADTII